MMTTVAAMLVRFQFLNMRRNSQDQSISTYQIRSNVDQYFVEHPDRIFLSYDDLIGPRRAQMGLNSIAGEDYHELFPVRADTERMSITMGDGRKNILIFTAKDRILVHQSPEGKLTGGVAAYQAWLAAQDRSDGVHVTARPQGRRFEFTWRGGVPDGPFRAYYKLWAEATYVHGAPSGRHLVYDRAGEIIYETVLVPWRRGS